MKKILKISLALLLSGFLFVSCGSSDDDDNNGSNGGNNGNAMAPTGLTYDGLTESSVRLLWTAGGDTDKYIVDFNGTEREVKTTHYIVSNTLTPSTNYTWRVRAVKGDDMSDWVDGVEFTTLAAPDLSAWKGLWENGEIGGEIELKTGFFGNFSIPLKQILANAPTEEVSAQLRISDGSTWNTLNVKLEQGSLPIIPMTEMEVAIGAEGMNYKSEKAQDIPLVTPDNPVTMGDYLKDVDLSGLPGSLGNIDLDKLGEQIITEFTLHITRVNVSGKLEGSDKIVITFVLDGTFDLKTQEGTMDFIFGQITGYTINVILDLQKIQE